MIALCVSHLDREVTKLSGTSMTSGMPAEMRPSKLSVSSLVAASGDPSHQVAAHTGGTRSCTACECWIEMSFRLNSRLWPPERFSTASTPHSTAARSQSGA